MSHELHAYQLYDYVDDSLNPDERRLLEVHLGQCGQCREELVAIRALRSRTSTLPRTLIPARDLWPGIRVRHRSRPSVVSLSRMRLAAAAVILVAATSGITALIVGRDASNSAISNDASLAKSGSSYPAHLRLESDFDAASVDLIAHLKQTRATLRPETIELMERNLVVINRAIDEIQTALKREPHNETLRLMLANTYRQKLDLLKQVSRSPAKI